MLDITALSSRYSVRRLNDRDADDLLAFCRENTQFYQYYGKQPSRELILNDLHMTPPGKDEASKYYVGFYDGETRVAIMDLIDGYPDDDCAYIGFFMMNKGLQGRQIGSGLVREVFHALKDAGFASVRLAIDKDNPQSNHFWKKNGFRVIKDVRQNGRALLVAERRLV